MREDVLLNSIKRRLYDMSIFDVRQVARAVGVPRATEGKKEDTIANILGIATGEITPLKPNGRGAPPKSVICDEQLVSDILRCRMFSFQSADKKLKTSVGDGSDSESYAEGIIAYIGGIWYMLCFDGAEVRYEVDNQLISRYCLNEGDCVLAILIKSNNSKEMSVCGIIAVNGEPSENHTDKNVKFEKLTRAIPRRRIKFNGGNAVCGIINIFSPLAFGQRAMVSAPSKTGKTTVLKHLAREIARDYPETEIVLMLLNEQPEIIEEFKNLFPNLKYFCTTFEKHCLQTVSTAHLAVEYAKRRVEAGKNVIILADGISRLYRSYLSAGKKTVAVSEITAMLYSASDYREGGSLTFIYTLSEESYDSDAYRLFADCANMRLKLSSVLSSRRIYPSVNIAESGADREEELLGADEYKAAVNLRLKLGSAVNEAEIIEMFKESDGTDKIIERFKD